MPVSLTLFLAAMAASLMVSGSAAIAALRDRHDTRTQCGRQRLAAVGGAVVGHHDLAVEAMIDPQPRERVERIADAMRQRLDLVEARHHDGHVDRRRCGIMPRARVCPYELPMLHVQSQLPSRVPRDRCAERRLRTGQADGVRKGGAGTQIFSRHDVRGRLAAQAI